MGDDPFSVGLRKCEIAKDGLLHSVSVELSGLDGGNIITWGARLCNLPVCVVGALEKVSIGSDSGIIDISV